MSTELDQIRAQALERIDRSERRTRWAVLGAAAWEALFLLAFLLIADLHNRTHLLLLVATVGAYTALAIGLVAVASHAERGNARVLKALALLGAR